MGKKHRIKITCSKCKRSLASENAVWTHIAFQHSSAKKPTRVREKDADLTPAIKPLFSCTGCDIRFEAESDLLAHIQTIENEDQLQSETSKHEEDAKPESSKQNNKYKPGKTKEVKKAQLDKEIVKCSSFKFYCALCRKQCGTENALLTHIAFKHVKVAANLTAKFICDNCKHVFDSLEDVTNHCHVVDNNSLDDLNSIVNNSCNKTKSSSPNNKNNPLVNSNAIDASDFIKDKPFIRSSSPKQDARLVTLEDSFEGQEGIHVVKDQFNENDDFDDFEDEEYSKIDDILESSGNNLEDKEVLGEKDEISEISNTATDQSTLKRHVPIILNSTANNDISDIVTDCRINLKNCNKYDTSDPVTNSKDDPKNDINDDISDFIALSHDNPKNKNKEISPTIADKHDDNLNNDNKEDVDDNHENPKNENNVDLDTSTTSSKDLSLSDLLEDEEGFDNKVNLFSTMLTNEVLTSRVRSLEDKVVELQEYMNRLLSEEDFPPIPAKSKKPAIESKSIPNHNQSPITPTTISNSQNVVVTTNHSRLSQPHHTSVIQCDKIESTTGSFDLQPNGGGFCEGEVVTFMDESVCEVEINTSRSEEIENMERDYETESNVIVDTETVLEKTNYELNEPVFKLQNGLQDDHNSLVADSSQHLHTPKEITNGTTSCESLSLIIDSGVGETLDTVETILEDDQVGCMEVDQVGCMEVDQVGCMEDDGEDPFDSCVLEQIRNGCIGSHELDSLFTSVISPHNQEAVHNSVENSPKMMILNPALEEKENQQLEATRSKLEPVRTYLDQGSNTSSTKLHHKSSIIAVNDTSTGVSSVCHESSSLEPDHTHTMVKLLQTKSLNGLDGGSQSSTINLNKQRQAAL